MSLGQNDLTHHHDAPWTGMSRSAAANRCAAAWARARVDDFSIYANDPRIVQANHRYRADEVCGPVPDDIQ